MSRSCLAVQVSRPGRTIMKSVVPIVLAAMPLLTMIYVTMGG